MKLHVQRINRCLVATYVPAYIYIYIYIYIYSISFLLYIFYKLINIMHKYKSAGSYSSDATVLYAYMAIMDSSLLIIRYMYM